ncbi:polyphosphate kinase [Clostridium acetobutylicum]|uniref:RNA degradosome polyphosphate kinase n=1 Tax=Clostridium TaxID=1485 RepID=UPI000200A687|nr:MULTISPECIES: RNA degradosome polyphosphate kinase [Clostridium]ADZ19673.1 polyphosphate kinase [Clostridium acetobutylicum EA 2018]AEI31342.1 polyphosphate kinase [Clostridium acetobutylicum DSM 1731]MBC2392509.1 RNA degradosome polyphosphate kinase [Clostridium acetobutylicum]MBC2583803.1 RNA degradosome polyphosphate kinase [Clostridium acetobutylicum]NOV89428.1 polyphosphate kinase [Clostridium acetobutylicum]
MILVKTFGSESFINRELSWIEFNRRVLEEAEDKTNPLLERFRFLSIASSNLDEFFMVRVASIVDQISAGITIPDIAGYTPLKKLQLIREKVHFMVYEEYLCFKELICDLKKQEITLINPKELSDTQKKYITNYYYNTIFPVITPIVVDKSRPFPLILNKSLNIALLIEGDNDSVIFGTVQVPSVIGRLVKLPMGNKFILLEDVIKMFSKELFNGHKILNMSCYRITRNADLAIDEEGAEDLLETIEQSIRRRKWGEVIRIEVEKNIDIKLLNILRTEVEADEADVYKIDGAIDLTFLNKIAAIKGYECLRYPKFEAQVVPEFNIKDKSMFEVIREKDVLLYHPYQSFQHVVDFVKKAASDPNVLAIKQTLYRVSGKSPIVEALMEAAENGKEVTVLVELKARFDEENNIVWAKRLEKSGCHVIYGLVGLKTHGKLLIVVRKEVGRIKSYVHMATGNYNDVTANFYTDLGLFTSNDMIAKDASSIFNMLSGYAKISSMNKLFVAPLNMRSKFIDLINEQIKSAKEGKNARIIVKINALVDRELITKLYEASFAGVVIDLIVRGICCLRPNYGEISRNINVISIVGRFLEHSRIFYFYNGEEEKVYLSSADWMTRNLDRRVEILFPVEDKKNKFMIKEQLKTYLMDNVKARRLRSDGSYERIEDSHDTLNSQKYFQEKAKKIAVRSSVRKKIIDFHR